MVDRAPRRLKIRYQWAASRGYTTQQNTHHTEWRRLLSGIHSIMIYKYSVGYTSRRYRQVQSNFLRLNRVSHSHIYLYYSPSPTSPFPKRKLPDDRVYTGQPDSSKHIPLKSKGNLKNSVQEQYTITTFLNSLLLGRASPPALKFPSAASQVYEYQCPCLDLRVMN